MLCDCGGPSRDLPPGRAQETMHAELMRTRLHDRSHDEKMVVPLDPWPEVTPRHTPHTEVSAKGRAFAQRMFDPSSFPSATQSRVLRTVDTSRRKRPPIAGNSEECRTREWPLSWGQCDFGASFSVGDGWPYDIPKQSVTMKKTEPRPTAYAAPTKDTRSAGNFEVLVPVAGRVKARSNRLSIIAAIAPPCSSALSWASWRTAARVLIALSFA
jgi:hypothetical protein